MTGNIGYYTALSMLLARATNGTNRTLEDVMPPKPGYKQPSKAGKAQVVVLLDPELRKAFKLASVERGETMQDILHRAIAAYAADALRRLRRKPK